MPETATYRVMIRATHGAGVLQFNAYIEAESIIAALNLGIEQAAFDVDAVIHTEIEKQP